jgi:hypothetical protein
MRACLDGSTFFYVVSNGRSFEREVTHGSEGTTNIGQVDAVRRKSCRAAEMGRKQVGAMLDMQKELIEAIEELNGEWAARFKAEAEFATKFTSKLTRRSRSRKRQRFVRNG